MEKIKCIFSFLLLFLVSFVYSQVAIGEVNVATDAILQFEDNLGEGLSIPKIEFSSLDPNSVPGTLFFDVEDSKAKVVETNLGVPTLKDLSVKDVPMANQYDASTDGYNVFNESQAEGLIIGADQTNAVGSLVLEHSSKAMVLPRVTSFEDIPNPEPGMIAYDMTLKSLIVYNGYKWTFWSK